jgi:hypothetical protein
LSWPLPQNITEWLLGMAMKWPVLGGFGSRARDLWAGNNGAVANERK